MKSTLSILGVTLDQVCVAAGERFGARAISPSAIALSSNLAITSALSRVGLPPGRTLIAAALAVSAAVASPPVDAQAVVVDDGSRVSADGRTEGNTAARLAGGVLGGLAGNSLAGNSTGLPRAAAVLGLAYVGQAVGDILTRNATDQHGRSLVRAGTDRKGRPVYQTLGEPLRQGSDSDPVHVSAEFYENALARASAPSAVVLDGVHTRRALDAQTHVGLYLLMVEAAASRALAKLANRDLDQAELARAVAPRDAQKGFEFASANRAYAQAFQVYAAAYRQAQDAIAIADRNGFDVSAQMLVMGAMPADLRRAPGVNIMWPGVDQRIRELGAQMQVSNSVSFAELVALGTQRPVQNERHRGD